MRNKLVTDKDEDSSLENINDTNYDKQYESLLEEEKKLSFNDSRSSYNSNKFKDDFRNQKTKEVLSVDDTQGQKSFRTQIDQKHFDKNLSGDHKEYCKLFYHPRV